MEEKKPEPRKSVWTRKEPTTEIIKRTGEQGREKREEKVRRSKKAGEKPEEKGDEKNRDQVKERRGKESRKNTGKGQEKK